MRYSQQRKITPMTNPTPSPIKQLHDEKTEAQRLGFSVRSLQAWRLRGGGPPYMKIGANVRYNPDLTDAWLNDQIRAHTTEAAA